ncbi:unnamed protein product, partial [Meganyctiphanes norvegica]
ERSLASMFTNRMAEADQPPAEPAKRKAKATASLNIARKEANRLKRVSRLLRKDAKGLTPQDQIFLEENSEDVEQFYKRREQRLVWQSRQSEQEDSHEELEEKSKSLAQAIHDAEFLVVYTGAGISTAASIPDYRGPNGIWTRMQKGMDIGSHDLSAAQPTITHMALAELYNRGIVRHVVSQNCDGLHLRSGLPKTAMSEVHGNMYIEVCKHCVPAREYVRTFDVTERTGTYKHPTGRRCYKCGEPLIDSIVHFGERGKLRWPLNWAGACHAANACDTILCLGSSLKVLKKYPWLWQMDRPNKRRPKLYIVNLQWTPKDKDATLKINGKCDEVMSLVLKAMGQDLPGYARYKDPIFQMATPLHPAEECTSSRPTLLPPNPEEVEEYIKKEQEEELKFKAMVEIEMKIKKEEEDSKCQSITEARPVTQYSPEQLEMLQKNELEYDINIKSEFPDKLNFVQSEIVKNLKSDPHDIKYMKSSEGCIAEQNLTSVHNLEKNMHECNNSELGQIVQNKTNERLLNEFQENIRKMEQTNNFTIFKPSKSNNLGKIHFENLKSQIYNTSVKNSPEGEMEPMQFDEENSQDMDEDSEGSYSDSETHSGTSEEDDDEDDEEDEDEGEDEPMPIIEDVSELTESPSSKNNIDYYKKAYASTNIELAKQGQALLKQNDFYGTGLCIRSINKPKLSQPNVKINDSSLSLDAIKQKNVENNSEVKNVLCNSENGSMFLHENIQVSESSNISSGCNSSSLPNVSSSTINESLRNTLNGLAYVNSSQSTNSLTNALAKNILCNQMQNITSSHALLNKVSNSLVSTSMGLKDKSSISLNSDSSAQNAPIGNKDGINGDGVLLTTQIVDGVIKTACVTESINDWNDDKSCVQTPTSSYSVNLSQNGQLNGKIQDSESKQIGRPNPASLNSQIVSQLALLESQKLQSIWYQSFCNMGSPNGELVESVKESLMSEMNVKNPNTSKVNIQESSLIMKNIYAAAINDKQKGAVLKKSKETVNEDVKYIWFWGFDANSHRASEVSKPTTESRVKIENASNDSDIEIIDIGSESDDSNTVRVTRSRTRIEPKVMNEEELIAKCHCKANNPELCKAGLHRAPPQPLDEDVVKARNIIRRSRTYNYRRFDPEFELKLESYTYEKLKPTRKSKKQKVENSKKICVIYNDDIEIIYDENHPKENCDFDVKEKEVKDEKSSNPGWYGIGLRKGM